LKKARGSFVPVIFGALCAIISIYAAACGSETVDPPISREEIEASMDAALLAVEPSPSAEFTYCAERLSDGRRYVFERDGSTMETSYQSASTSKLVTAVIILRLVEAGYLSLDDSPQDYLSAAVWPVPDTDPLHGITLAHLLSFTSGLNVDPSGLFTSIDDEMIEIADVNVGGAIVPGTQFYYGSNHLQVAGAMAIEARDAADAADFLVWQDVFDEFRTQTGLFTHSAFDLPPLQPNNPRLAGGMHWTASDYMEFLGQLARGEILSPAMMTQFLQDRTGMGVAIVYSPLLVHPDMEEDWHYGFGFWHEYEGNPWAGTPGARISSPGAYGAYPFWDRVRGYVGIVARQGGSGTFPEGVFIERAVRPLTEAWIALP